MLQCLLAAVPGCALLVLMQRVPWSRRHHSRTLAVALFAWNSPKPLLLAMAASLLTHAMGNRRGVRAVPHAALLPIAVHCRAHGRSISGMTHYSAAEIRPTTSESTVLAHHTAPGADRACAGCPSGHVDARHG